MWVKISFLAIWLQSSLIFAHSSCEEAMKLINRVSQFTSHFTDNKFGLNLKLAITPPQVTEINLEFIISQLKLRKPKDYVPAVKYMSMDPLGEFIVIKFADEWQPSFLPYANRVYVILKKTIVDAKTGTFQYQLYSRFYLSPHQIIRRLIFSQRATRLILHLANKDYSKSSINVLDILPGWSVDTQQMHFEINTALDQILFYANPQDPTQFLIALIKSEKLPNNQLKNLVRFVSYSTLSGHITPLGKITKLSNQIHKALMEGDSESNLDRAYFNANLSKGTFTLRSALFILEFNHGDEISFSAIDFPSDRIISQYQPWLSHGKLLKENRLSIYNSTEFNGSLELKLDLNQQSFNLEFFGGALISTPGNGFLFQEQTATDPNWIWFGPNSSTPVYLKEINKLSQVIVTPTLLAGIKNDRLGYPRLILIDLFPQIEEVANK